MDILNVKQPEIFESVFHKYYASLCYFANKFVRDDEAARDIVQEVFLRFWESKGKFENQSALKSFLYNCVQNAALNYLEKLQVPCEGESAIGIEIS
ncbi:MAG: sigma-70 family RNA polymerase sigma factor [Butyricimonas faecihominis]